MGRRAIVGAVVASCFAAVTAAADSGFGEAAFPWGWSTDVTPSYASITVPSSSSSTTSDEQVPTWLRRRIKQLDAASDRLVRVRNPDVSTRRELVRVQRQLKDLYVAKVAIMSAASAQRSLSYTRERVEVQLARIDRILAAQIAGDLITGESQLRRQWSAFVGKVASAETELASALALIAKGPGRLRQNVDSLRALELDYRALRAQGEEWLARIEKLRRELDRPICELPG